MALQTSTNGVQNSGSAAEAGSAPYPLRDAQDSNSGYSEPGAKSVKHRNAPHQQAFAPPWKNAFMMPNQSISIPKDLEPMEPSLMSWWPMLEAPDSQVSERKSTSTQPMKVKKESLFRRLEHRLGGLVLGTGEHHRSNGKAQPSDTKHFTETNRLFTVVLTLTHMQKDMDTNLEGVHIYGTFDSLSTAKGFAHRCLFDLGYEQEWFTTFETQHEGILINHKPNEIVRAIGSAGEEFQVNVCTVPNVFDLKANDVGRVETPLYHVVQTVVHYGADDSGQTRDTTVQGSFRTFQEARMVALSALLWEDENISRDTYAQYEEAGPDELDCGYGENVIVHAIGQDGENFVVSVLKGFETEAERVSEASGAMRA